MHTVGILVFAGLSYVVSAGECGHAGCNADGRIQETGSSMLQSKAPSKPKFMLMVEAGQKLSTQMGIDASSAVGKLMDRTMDMLLRAEGIGDASIVAQVQEQLTKTVNETMLFATQYEKKDYDAKLKEINELTFDEASLNGKIILVNDSGNEAIVCNATYTDKIEEAKKTCTETEEIKKKQVFPEGCKIDELKKYANSASENGTGPVCKHFTDIASSYDNYYSEFATELKNCAAKIKGLSFTAQNADKNCTDSETNVTETAKKCNETEAKLEIKLCEASATLTSECSSYSKLYETKANALAKIKADNLKHVASREKEYRGLGLIMCFLTTVAEKDTGTAQQAAFQECENKEVDVSPVQYSMADPDPMKTCDYSAQVAKLISDFKDYLGASALAECNLTMA